MARQNDYVYELRELMQNFAKAFEKMGEAARESMDALAASFPPPAVEDEQPEPASDTFRHRDSDGDSFALGPVSLGGSVLGLETYEDRGVYLDQDAVNRLARYLDQHRTDQVDTDPAPAVPCIGAYRRAGAGGDDWCELDVHGDDVLHKRGLLRWTNTSPHHYWRKPDEAPKDLCPCGHAYSNHTPECGHVFTDALNDAQVACHCTRYRKTWAPGDNR